jgi:hypothetical protein
VGAAAPCPGPSPSCGCSRSPSPAADSAGSSISGPEGPQSTLRVQAVARARQANAHSSAVRAVAAAGPCVFSTGLDRRVRCWSLQSPLGPQVALQQGQTQQPQQQPQQELRLQQRQLWQPCEQQQRVQPPGGRQSSGPGQLADLSSAGDELGLTIVPVAEACVSEVMEPTALDVSWMAAHCRRCGADCRSELPAEQAVTVCVAGGGAQVLTLSLSEKLL